MPAPITQATQRITLLHYDLAAWHLSTSLPNSQVAATRTELDWALRQPGLIAIWAPQELVLRAAADSAPDPADPIGMALWIAGQFGADGIIHCGDLPARDGVSVATSPEAL